MYPVFGFIGLCVFVLWPASMILTKAGYSPWFCLLLAVPLVNIVSVWIFATSPWPALRR